MKTLPTSVNHANLWPAEVGVTLLEWRQCWAAMHNLHSVSTLLPDNKKEDINEMLLLNGFRRIANQNSELLYRIQKEISKSKPVLAVAVAVGNAVPVPVAKLKYYLMVGYSSIRQFFSGWSTGQSNYSEDLVAFTDVNNKQFYFFQSFDSLSDSSSDDEIPTAKMTATATVNQKSEDFIQQKLFRRLKNLRVRKNIDNLTRLAPKTLIYNSFKPPIAVGTSLIRTPVTHKILVEPLQQAERMEQKMFAQERNILTLQKAQLLSQRPVNVNVSPKKSSSLIRIPTKILPIIPPPVAAVPVAVAPAPPVKPAVAVAVPIPLPTPPVARHVRTVIQRPVQRAAVPNRGRAQLRPRPPVRRRAAPAVRRRRTVARRQPIRRRGPTNRRRAVVRARRR